jgi:dTDP-glucose pyrophosphorylase
MLQVVIPMAGLGSRFTDYGFKTNKYLLPINIDLQPMIELSIITLNISVPCKFFFIINEEQGVNENIRKLLSQICKKYGYDYHISSVSRLTEGPASTVNIVRDVIDKNEPLIVSNSDQVLEQWDFIRFITISDKYDGCVLTYKPNYDLQVGATDKHSFIHINENGQIDECREKIVLSEKALVGVHYFKKALYFFEAYDYMVDKNIRAPNGEFYLSLCYQSMIELGHNIGYCDMDDSKEKYYPVGEPTDYFNYLQTNGGYKHFPIELVNYEISHFTMV